MEAGESLFTNLAADGRKSVRQQIEALKQDWESLYDDVAAAQRQLDLSLVEWTSFADSTKQLEAWLQAGEWALSGELPLHAMLDEKNSQLQMYKVVYV